MKTIEIPKGTYNTIQDAKRNNRVILEANDYLKNIVEEMPKKKVTVKSTSHEANNKKDKTTDHKLILSVLSETNALTFREIANLLKWSEPVRASRRMSELISLKKAKENTPRAYRISGRNCTTYLKINEAG